MRIGIANPFAYRPHVAQMAFLTRQLHRLGHQTFVISCGGDLRNCNSKVNKTGIARRLECLKCHAGGIRSYLDVDAARLDLQVRASRSDIELGRACAFSTAATALQIEQRSEADAADFQALQADLSEPAAIAYLNARRWVRQERLDCVFVFNGRFDLTQAIVEACKSECVRFVSVERSWFGDGLQLLPDENCLGLRNVHMMCERWAERPLKYDQAARASQLITRRLLRTSVGEWRQYNIGSTARYEKESIKYLFLPSSQHEWIGHPDRASSWQHPVEGIEYLFGKLGLPMRALVVRGHPGWSMKIKSYGCNRANEFYRNWTGHVGAEYIEPSAAIDSHQLMRVSRLVLVNGSSASMEASWLGKPLVSFIPAPFTSSGISRNLFSRSDVDGLDAASVEALIRPDPSIANAAAQCRRALRYMYCVNFRVMQFVRSVKSPSPRAIRCADQPDLSGLESLVVEGILREDDTDFDRDDSAETRVVASILSGAHDAISGPPEDNQSASALVKRRSVYRLIDLFSR